MLNKVGFEYLDKQGESVFETFLKYTDEKEKSSTVLGKILKRLLNKDRMIFLDVGSGNGECLRLSLNQIKLSKRVEFTLLEPSRDLIKRLRLTAKGFPLGVIVKIVHSTFDDFTASSQFDVILASHLPFARERLPQVFERMLDLLRIGGYLIIILRRKDDIHEFRTTFKSQLMGKDYQSLTIDDALEVFDEFAKIRPLRISTFSADSELHLPITDNMQDVVSIVEFLLNKKWKEFPRSIREAVLDYVNQRKGILHQTDGFALVRKI
ncbi:MAG: class I SAM-dependent methyltransferase [Patescibacteria group bacterium]